MTSIGDAAAKQVVIEKRLADHVRTDLPDLADDARHGAAPRLWIRCPRQHPLVEVTLRASSAGVLALQRTRGEGVERFDPARPDELPGRTPLKCPKCPYRNAFPLHSLIRRYLEAVTARRTGIQLNQ